MKFKNISIIMEIDHLRSQRTTLIESKWENSGKHFGRKKTAEEN